LARRYIDLQEEFKLFFEAEDEDEEEPDKNEEDLKQEE
jgi:hypothetical protein